MNRRRSAGGLDAVMLVIGAGVVVVLVGLVGLLSGRSRPVLGDNGRPPGHIVADLRPGETLCQLETAVPAGADALGVVAGPLGPGAVGPLSVEVAPAPPPVGATGGDANPGQALSARRSEIVAPTPTFRPTGTVSPPPSPLARGEVPVQSPSSVGVGRAILVPLDRPLTAGGQADICLHNRGATLALFGDPDAAPTGLVRGVKAFGLSSFSYAQRRPTTWWSRLGTVARRFGLVKAPWFGSWTMWAAFGGVALIWAGTLARLRHTLRA